MILPMPKPGAVIFVADVGRLSDFYRSVAAMTVVHADVDHAVLELQGFQLVIHRLSGKPPTQLGKVTVREDSYFKLCLPVSSITAARSIAAGLGGVVMAAEHEWNARDYRACDGHDPEGNIFQVREGRTGMQLPSSESVIELSESQMALVFSFYGGVARMGPGSEESTLKALNLLDGLPINPRIVEFGCGAGVATIALARSIACHITAVDIHLPFLEELDRSAVRAGVKVRITALKADLGTPPFPDESFDVVWSEGAIYNIGFEQGLRRWRRLLRTGGYVAVSEAVWLTKNPPQRAKEFWEAEYPPMTSVEENLSKLSATGFAPVSHFVLPLTDWENYYLPLQAHLEEYRERHAANAAAASLVNKVQREIDIWKNYGTTFGYAFYVGRAV